jgi:hypothetical protein
MYVRLKHALSDYTIAAVRDPERAQAAAWLAGYAAVAPDGRSAAVGDVRTAAYELIASASATRPAWRLTAGDLGPLTERRLLWHGRGAVALPRRFRPFAPYFRSQAERLLRAVLCVANRPAHPVVPDAVYRGLVLFDFGLFFAAHEHFEDIWRAASGPERFAVHGLIQIAAAFYHHEKSNARGAATLLRRARDKLARAPGRHLGLDVAVVDAAVAPWEARFARGETAPWPAFATAAAAQSAEVMASPARGEQA